MKVPPFFILMICFASTLLADDFKTIAGKEYKDATVTRVEPDGVLVKYKSGISKLYFVELPKEV
jgi:sRNA-binding protein